MNENLTLENRIFKLSNGEEINPVELEKIITDACHYIKYVIVSGEGKEKPVALVFPNTHYYDNPDYKIVPEQGCFCPRNLSELGKCLTGCMKLANSMINDSARLSSATIVNTEVMINRSAELMNRYRETLLSRFGKNIPQSEEIYVINLDKK